MTSLNIEQSTSSTENVNSVIIEKLYALALTSKVQDLNSDFTMTLLGNILAPSAYEDSVLYLRSKFPNLTITVQDNNFYIRFADPEVERVLMANNISSDGVAVSKTDALNTTTFAASMFEGNTTILTFDELDEFGALDIKTLCFRDATNLRSVDFSRVSMIRYEAFKNTALSGDLAIPNLTTMETGAFRDCVGLTSVSDLGSIATLSKEAFRSCSGLETVVLPSSVGSIGELAFYYCTSLTSINGLTQISTLAFGAFEGCSSLTTIGLHTINVLNIPTSIFAKCNNLEGEFNFPDATVMADNSYGRLFVGCSKITKLTFGHIKRFGPGSEWSSNERGSFAYCTSLKLVDLGDSIVEFRECAFTGDNNLKAIVFRGNTPPAFNQRLGGLVWTYSAFLSSDSASKNSWSFWFGNPNTKIYVPDEALTDYRAHEAFTLNPNYVLPLSEFNELTIMAS